MDVFYYILGICLLEEEINIMIDIIIPVYNAERFLKRCVDSILMQTNPTWNLILVDDGSIDNSGNLCDFYAENTAT